VSSPRLLRIVVTPGPCHPSPCALLPVVVGPWTHLPRLKGGIAGGPWHGPPRLLRAGHGS
jgi:hypothetical protein